MDVGEEGRGIRTIAGLGVFYGAQVGSAGGGDVDEARYLRVDQDVEVGSVRDGVEVGNGGVATLSLADSRLHVR